jgi:xylan 1,4-beta-xylosidase
MKVTGFPLLSSALILVGAGGSSVSIARQPSLRPSVAAAPGATARARPEDRRAVSITVDATRSDGVLPPIWRFFGADEPNYATMKDGRKLLTKLGELRPGQVYFRAHNLLTSGDGTPALKWGSTNAYTEDKNGKAVYDWTIVDRIIDTYRARGIRPYLEIGFMPEALSSAPLGMPYQHEWRQGIDAKPTGWTYPPKDYAKWGELVYQWTLHNVAKYGREEVERWYFEVWNEPNLDFYWQGTPEQFYRLQDVSVDAVRRALPTARVGGPDVAGTGGALMDGFLKHVTTGRNYATGKVGTPTDFVSFHAKGSPDFVDGHIRMGISAQLRDVDATFGKIASIPQLAAKPIVIGESDPEGCAACLGPKNSYRNGTMYSSYTVASFARMWELARRRKVNLEGVLSWSFEFEDQPWFAGFRQLATNGVDLPVLNVFRLFAKLGTDRLPATSSAQMPLDKIIAAGVRAEADVGSIATRTSDGRIAILLWHYHDDDVPGPAAAVKLSVHGVNGGTNRSAKIWRVDGDHGNAFSAWQRMGSPQLPNTAQYGSLITASAMHEETLPSVRGTGNAVDLDVVVPRHGVALVVLDDR